MTPKEAKKVIDQAFHVVQRASHLTTETRDLFERAHSIAIRDETHNRRHAWVKGGRWKNSVETAARYFVVKWFFEPARATNVREAAGLRLDCLYASALRAAVDAARLKMTPKEARAYAMEEAGECLDLGRVDYAEHLSNGVGREKR